MAVWCPCAFHGRSVSLRHTEQTHVWGGGVGRNLQCLGRVGRAGRTAASVCSRWVRGRLRYPETVPSWLRTSAGAVATNAEKT